MQWVWEQRRGGHKGSPLAVDSSGQLGFYSPGWKHFSPPPFVTTPKVGLVLPELSDRERIELPAVDGGPSGSVIVIVVRRCFPLTTFYWYSYSRAR